MTRTITQDLNTLLQAAQCNEEENQRFRVFLKQQESVEVDEIVHQLNTEISALVNCTQCGNCCRSLMINVEPGESEALSAYLQISTREFKELFIEESEQGQLVVNTIPCHFLSDNKCSVYEHRFTECREFPHLHRPGFTTRLFGTLMHYGRCPIIYNVIEELKNRSGFSTILTSSTEQQTEV